MAQLTDAADYDVRRRVAEMATQVFNQFVAKFKYSAEFLFRVGLYLEGAQLLLFVVTFVLFLGRVVSSCFAKRRKDARGVRLLLLPPTPACRDLLKVGKAGRMELYHDL